MAEIRWHCFDDADGMAQAAAGHVQAVIHAATSARGAATLAVPGGKTPTPIFARLADTPEIDWANVTLLPTDDRLVAEEDPLSNLRLLRVALGGTGVRIVPLTASGALDPAAAAAFAERALAGIDWPIDLLWLGVGGDGHTGSILPGPDFAAALAAETLAAAVTPDPLPPEAPVARITLTRHAMRQTRGAMLTISGAAKRAVLERAIAERAESGTAIGAVLAAMPVPVDLFWSP
jgi:6-phosphogluconolactonase